MTIDKNTVVSVHYELRMDADDGMLVEKVTSEQPMTFLFGAGNLIPAFEANLKGKIKGDFFSFKIESSNAYGPYHPESVVDLPKEIFEVEGVNQEEILVLGNYVDMHDKAGNMHKGKVMEVTDAQVKMDFNHPLAGKDLFFSGGVMEIREATSEELDHGHVHGEGGVHH